MKTLAVRKEFPNRNVGLSMEGSTIEFAVLYRWRLLPGAEAAFTKSWAEVTQQLKTRGGRGSRLHLAEDGTFWAYAQWPSAKAREDAFRNPVDIPASGPMADFVSERFEEIRLEVVADLLV